MKNSEVTTHPLCFKRHVQLPWSKYIQGNNYVKRLCAWQQSCLHPYSNTFSASGSLPRCTTRQWETSTKDGNNLHNLSELFFTSAYNNSIKTHNTHAKQDKAARCISTGISAWHLFGNGQYPCPIAQTGKPHLKHIFETPDKTTTDTNCFFAKPSRSDIIGQVK